MLCITINMVHCSGTGVLGTLILIICRLWSMRWPKENSDSMEFLIYKNKGKRKMHPRGEHIRRSSRARRFLIWVLGFDITISWNSFNWMSNYDWIERNLFISILFWELPFGGEWKILCKNNSNNTNHSGYAMDFLWRSPPIQQQSRS